MATTSAPTLDGGWTQRDDASASSLPTLGGGWEQVDAVGGGTTTYTLSTATWTNLTATGVTPRVTVTVA